MLDRQEKKVILEDKSLLNILYLLIFILRFNKDIRIQVFKNDNRSDSILGMDIDDLMAYLHEISNIEHL